MDKEIEQQISLWKTEVKDLKFNREYSDSWELSNKYGEEIEKAESQLRYWENKLKEKK